MTFHRYVTPTYFGGLPAGYDLINVTSGGTGAGGSAFADSAKSSGPNVGTYLVAFGEDATSSNANRGLRALSQNTDAIDDLLRRDLAFSVRTNDATAGGPVATVVLPTNTFLGTSGYTTSVADLARLFSILDSNDDEIIDPTSGNKVQVTSVTLGSGDVIGGSGGNGSFSGNTVTLNISPSIPTTTVYRIWYGSRTNLATMPADVLTTIKIRAAEEVPAEVENLFRLLHGNNLAWNTSWTSTIYDLAAGGLNDRYNRATAAHLTAPEPYWATDIGSDDGSGGWIQRTGPALTVYSAGDLNALSDPLNALFTGKSVDLDPTVSGGVVGYAYYGSRRSSTANANETAQGRTPGGASFMALWPHDFGAVSAVNFRTKVTAGAACTLSMVGAFNVDTGEAIVQLSGTDYFRNGSGNSAVASGYDLLEVTYIVSSVTHYETFVIVSLGSSTDPTNATKCRVRRLNGTVPNFTSATGVAVRWVSTSFAIGDGGGTYHSSKNGYANTISVRLDSLFYQVPPEVSDNGGDNSVVRLPVSISGQENTNGFVALQWGGFSTTLAKPSFNGQLLGDGSISTAGSLNCNNIIANGATLTGITMSSGTATLFDVVVTDFLDLHTTSLRRRMRRARTLLSDADHSVNVSQGDRFVLNASPASARTITLVSVAVVPNDGECLEFICNQLSPSGTQYTFQREDATVIATIVGTTTAAQISVSVEFEFTAGVWRLGTNSGSWRDTSPANVGVVAGAGA